MGEFSMFHWLVLFALLGIPAAVIYFLIRLVKRATRESEEPRPRSAGATSPVGSLEIHSNPDGADVYVDSAFIGQATAMVKLTPGQHTIRVSVNGYKDWSRELTVQSGSNAHLTATLDRQ